MRVDPIKSNRFFLEEQESLLLEPGAMLAFQNCGMKTELAAGGIFQKLRLYFLGGEPLFRNRLTAENGKAWISLEEQMPGQIQTEVLRGGEPGLIIRNGAYLGHTGPVHLDTQYQGIKGYMEGKGFTGIRAQVKEGEGTVLFHTSGAKVEKILVDPANKAVTIDNEMILAYSENLNCKLVRLGRGMAKSFCSGEGLACEFRGKGVVYVSTGGQEREKTLANLVCERTSIQLYSYMKWALVGSAALAAYGAYAYFTRGENIVHSFGDFLFRLHNEGSSGRLFSTESLADQTFNFLEMEKDEPEPSRSLIEAFEKQIPNFIPGLSLIRGKSL